MKPFKNTRNIIITLLICTLFIAIVICTLIHYGRTSRNSYSERMSELSSNQMLLASNILDSVKNVAYESSSNINFINTGLMADPDTTRVAALACQSLKHIESINEAITNIYLICVLNNTIYSSTDYQSYELNNFYDLAWMKQYHSSTIGIQQLDSPRVVSSPYRQVNTFISFLTKVPYFSTLNQKYLVFNVDIEKLGKTITSASGSTKDFNPKLIIFNDSGALLYSQDNIVVDNEELRNEESNIAPDEYSIITIAETQYFITSQVDKNGWKYCEIIPYSTVLAARNAKAVQLLFPLFTILIIFSLFTFKINKRKNILINRSIQKLSDASRVSVENDENNLSLLEQLSSNIYEQSITDRNILSESQPVLTEHVIKAYLYNEFTNPSKQKYIQSIMDQYGLFASNKCKYSVLIVKVDAIDSFKINQHHNLYNQLRNTIQYGCKELMPLYCESFYTWTNASLLCSVVSFPDDMTDEDIVLSMREIGQNAQSHIALLSQKNAISAFSDITDSIENIHLCYDHAKQLIEYKTFHKAVSPYTYYDMMADCMEMDYDKQKKLINLVRLGKTTEASDVLNNYYSMLHGNPDVNISYAVEVSTRLLNNVYLSVNKENSSNSFKITPPAASIDQIKGFNTIHEIAECVINYICDISGIMHSISESYQDSRVQEVLQWINNNYNHDISLSDVASHMELSTAYTSRLIKQSAGMTFIMYLNTIRIEHAKELLTTTDLSNVEISEYVGFSYPQNFIRNFCKYTSMTPGNYRSLNKVKSSVTYESDALDPE